MGLINYYINFTIIKRMIITVLIILFWVSSLLLLESFYNNLTAIFVIISSTIYSGLMFVNCFISYFRRKG